MMSFSEGIKARDIVAVDSALNAGVPPNTLIEDRHPLHCLLDGFGWRWLVQMPVDEKVERVFCRLLEAGADPNAIDIKNDSSQTVLQRLCSMGVPNREKETDNNALIKRVHRTMMEALFKKDVGINKNESGDPSKSPICIAVKHGDEVAAVRLLEANAHVPESMRNRILDDARLSELLRDPTIIHHLLLNGATYTEEQNGFFTWLAFNQNHVPLRDYLMSKGAISCVNDRGELAGIVLDSKTDKVLTLQFLLSHGADITARNSRGQTPLYGVLRDWLTKPSKELELLVNAMLEHGANMKLLNDNGGSLLQDLDFSKNVDTRRLQQLLEWGIELDHRDAHGKTALFKAVEEGKNDYAGILLEHGASPSIPCHEGCYPLEKVRVHFFLDLYDTQRNHDESCVQANKALFLKLFEGLPSGHKPVNGAALLHIAVGFNDQPLVQSLLDRDVSIASVLDNFYDNSILHTGVSFAPELIAWLIEKGAPVDARNKYRQTPLTLATSKFQKSSIEILLKSNANPHVVDQMGRSLIHIWFIGLNRFLKEGSVEEAILFLKLLINAGADIQARDEDGNNLIELLLDEPPKEVESHLLTLAQCFIDLNIAISKNFLNQSRLCELALMKGNVRLIKHLVGRSESKNALLELVFHHGVDSNSLELVNLALQIGLDLSVVGEGSEYNFFDEAWNFSKSKDSKEFQPIIIRLLEELEEKNQLHLLTNEILLHFAKLDWVEQIQWVLRRCPQIEVSVFSGDENRKNPVTVAVHNNSVSVLQFLVERGIPLDAEFGLFVQACFKGFVDIVRVFLKNGIDSNQRFKGRYSHLTGDTTLFREMLLGTKGSKDDSEILTLLLQKGAVVEAEDVQTAIVRGVSVDLLKLMRERISPQHWRALFPLHIAVQYEQKAVIDWLLGCPERQDLLNSINHQGQTVLHLSTQPGYEDLYHELIKRGADPSFRDNQGIDVRTYAICHGTYQNLEMALPGGINAEMIEQLKVRLLEEEEFIKLQSHELKQLRFQLNLSCYRLASFFSDLESCKAYIASYRFVCRYEPIQTLTRFHVPSSNEGSWDKQAWSKLALMQVEDLGYGLAIEACQDEKILEEKIAAWQQKKPAQREKQFLLLYSCVTKIWRFCGIDGLGNRHLEFLGAECNRMFRGISELVACRQPDSVTEKDFHSKLLKTIALDLKLVLLPENYLHNAVQIEAKLGRMPHDFAELMRVNSTISYRRCQKDLQLANLFKQHHIPEFVFNRVLDSKMLKSEDYLPEISIDGKTLDSPEPEYCWQKLHRSDLRGYVLGKYTGCCQYVGGPGEACAWHGMTSSWGGFYVVTKSPKPKEIEKAQSLLRKATDGVSYDEFLKSLDKNQRKKYRERRDVLCADHQINAGDDANLLIKELTEELAEIKFGVIVAQCWGWMNDGVLVLDSWEYNNQIDDKLCVLFLNHFADEALKNHGITEVRLGTSGQTPPDLPFELAKDSINPCDYVGYRDSAEQWLIAKASPTLS